MCLTLSNNDVSGQIASYTFLNTNPVDQEIFDQLSQVYSDRTAAWNMMQARAKIEGQSALPPDVGLQAFYYTYVQNPGSLGLLVPCELTSDEASTPTTSDTTHSLLASNTDVTAVTFTSQQSSSTAISDLLQVSRYFGVVSGAVTLAYLGKKIKDELDADKAVEAKVAFNNLFSLRLAQFERKYNVDGKWTTAKDLAPLLADLKTLRDREYGGKFPDEHAEAIFQKLQEVVKNNAEKKSLGESGSEADLRSMTKKGELSSNRAELEKLSEFIASSPDGMAARNAETTAKARRDTGASKGKIIKGIVGVAISGALIGASFALAASESMTLTETDKKIYDLLKAKK